MPSTENWMTENLRCPRCQGGVAFEGSADLYQGSLLCRDCGAAYPVRSGIPRFSDNQYCESFSTEWRTFRRTQLDSYTGTSISRDRFIECTGFQPEEFRGKKVLEAGCGAGRFVEVLARAGAEIFAVDISEAVDAARANLQQFPKVHFVQASLFDLPFGHGFFDFVFSIGVLHHTPDTRAAFLEIVPYAKTGGAVSVWVYHKSESWLRRLYLSLTLWPLYKAVFRNLDPRRSLAVLRYYVPLALRLTRIPFAGRILKRALPVCDYRKTYPGLTSDLITEWAMLDTYDAFTPRYQNLHTWDEVGAWFGESGLDRIRKNQAPVSYTGYRT